MDHPFIGMWAQSKTTVEDRMNQLRGGRYNDECQTLPADSNADALPIESRIASYDFPIATFCGQSFDPLGNVGIPTLPLPSGDTPGIVTRRQGVDAKYCRQGR